MRVTFVSQVSTAPLLSRAIGMAIEKRLPVSRSYIKWSVEVPDWPAWLRCLWHGYADLSRGCNADDMRKRYIFEVSLDGSSSYNVWVVFDEQSGGLRYGSLDV